MIKLIDKFIIPLIIALVAGGVLYWYQFDKPEVRYSLSEKLPISFSSKVNENIQLLEVKNVGKTEAIGIVVKSNIPIVNYELQKNTKLDSVEASKEGEAFELKYSTLPPGAAFKVILKTSGGWLTDNDLMITHSKGKASNAFNRNNNESLLSVTFLLVFVGLIVMFISSIRDFAVRMLESKITYDQDNIIKRIQKPFYVGIEKWVKIRHEAWEYKLTSDITKSYTALMTSSSLKILNTERPNYFEKDEWDKLVVKANDVFLYIIKLATSSSFSKVPIEILSMEKPEHLNGDKWSKITELITEHISSYLWHSGFKSLQDHIDSYMDVDNHKMSDYYRQIHKNVIVDIIYDKYLNEIDRAARPLNYIKTASLDFIEESKKNKLFDYAYRLQHQKITDKMIYSNNMLIILKDPDYLLLNDKDRVKIKTIIYQHELVKYLPVSSYETSKKFIESPVVEWIEDSDYSDLLDIAKNIVSACDDKSLYTAKNNELKSLVNLSSLSPNRPEIINEDDWNALKELEEKLCLSIKRCETAKRRISKIKNTYECKHQKINHKLSVLDRILSDPRYMDKVEDIYDLFTPGNIANLKALSKGVA